MTDLDESVLLGDPAEHHDDPIDETALLDEKEVKEEVDDLYEDAIAPTDSEGPVVKNVPTTGTVSVTPSAPSTYGAKASASNEGRKYCCYVGNLLWYTTDADLMKAIASTGLSRSLFADMKFFENRTNGQSKGYALLVLNSDAAVKQIMESLPAKPIHGQSPTVLAYNKTNQAKLEEAQAKNQTRPDVKKKAFETGEGCLNMGTIRIGAGGQTTRTGGTAIAGRPTPQPLMMQTVRPLMSQTAPLLSNQNQVPQMRLQINGQSVQMLNRNPVPQTQGLMGSAPMGQLSQPMQQQQPQMLMGAQQVRPMMQPTMGMQPIMGMNLGGPPPMSNQFQTRPPQLNPLGVQPLMQMNTGMRPPNNGMQPVHVNPQMFANPQSQVSDAEFEDVLTRNRTVSTSAISRALTDASVGDIKGATETILTAIALIKQSRIAQDDRCRQLVFTLEDTLNNLEKKGYPSRSSRSHRDRSRSRERDRKRRRRSRTRSRSYSRSPSPRRRRY